MRASCLREELPAPAARALHTQWYLRWGGARGGGERRIEASPPARNLRPTAKSPQHRDPGEPRRSRLLQIGHFRPSLRSFGQHCLVRPSPSSRCFRRFHATWNGVSCTVRGERSGLNIPPASTDVPGRSEVRGTAILRHRARLAGGASVGEPVPHLCGDHSFLRSLLVR
ncbi:hypothetical protein KM043_017796 [Ampulex compressa]|nr:hypothetical protein KM043_017796 [Ampulex compressa]